MSINKGTGEHITAVKLSSDKVFIVYERASTYSARMYCIVCTISGYIITKGTEIELSLGAGTVISSISASALSEDKVFIAHHIYNSGANNLYGIVCTISGTTITKGTATSLSSMSNSIHISIITLSTEKVFIAYLYGSYTYLYGIVCTINGSTITAGTNTQLSSINSSGLGVSAILISNNRIFIAHSNYGLVCTISGTIIIKGIDARLNTISNSCHVISAVKLSEDKIFITYNVGNSMNTDYYLYGAIYLIDVGYTQNIQLSDSINSAYYISTIGLSEDKVLIVHSNGTTFFDLYAMICTTEDKSGLHNIYNSFDKIFGVAKEAGSEDEVIEIYIPNIKEV